jgi:hypothetical protein
MISSSAQPDNISITQLINRNNFFMALYLFK